MQRSGHRFALNSSASRVDHTLCGFFRAPNPFIILDNVLLRKDSPVLEHHAVHQGARIADQMDDNGNMISP